MKGTRTSSSGERLLTVAEVARALSASRDVVERLIKQGELSALDVSPVTGHAGHRPMLRVQSEDLQEFLEARRVRVIPAAPRLSRKARGANDIIQFV